ncbi:MAG: imidazoleglycerol-phosphate dehydratase HisB [Candidatus Gastranaerophilales bacterium]|nr:imidazoleglycerol-phosphate dehydratase HisB [Candidatus Gastranaerophilales bacterium]
MQRTIEKTRTTKETDINLKLNLDGEGLYKIETPCNFFNHMLEQLSAHSGINIDLSAKALDNNFHHLIEDCAIIIGQAINEALKDKKGIARYSNMILPMDEALILCALDISQRPYFKLDMELKDEKTDDFETILFHHFFNSLALNAGICLHIKMLDGYDTHHIIEASFKAFAKCLKEAIKITSDKIPSTKGLL